MTLTLASLLGEISGAVASFVPDFGLYIAAAFIVGLSAVGVRRFRRAFR